MPSCPDCLASPESICVNWCVGGHGTAAAGGAEFVGGPHASDAGPPRVLRLPALGTTPLLLIRSILPYDLDSSILHKLPPCSVCKRW
jgi:hypothetical protein